MRSQSYRGLQVAAEARVFDLESPRFSSSWIEAIIDAKR
jgi:hypothetical protein